jgi:endonuclease-3
MLQLMGASLLLGGLAGCGPAPREEIVPYVREPERNLPGRPRYYATALTHAGYAQGVLVESHQGRPTKVEGNPLHPSSLGGTDVYAQAAVLGLYDPDPPRPVARGGEPARFEAFAQDLAPRLAGWAARRGAGVCLLTETVTSPTLASQLGEWLRAYPEARCWLLYENPLQLRVATMLSAQCTDARVNLVTPALFRRFPDAASFARARQVELEERVRSTGFYRNKARAIREACRDILVKHGGEVPRTLEELTALRGVGRKTANVVLGNAFGIPGMVVDTHVGRLSVRLGLTREKDPVKVEFELSSLLPPRQWVALGHRMIAHGRKHCKAPKPRCTGCPLERICPYENKRFEDAG